MLYTYKYDYSMFAENLVDTLVDISYIDKARQHNMMNKRVQPQNMYCNTYVPIWG